MNTLHRLTHKNSDLSFQIERLEKENKELKSKLNQYSEKLMFIKCWNKGEYSVWTAHKFSNSYANIEEEATAVCENIKEKVLIVKIVKELTPVTKAEVSYEQST